MIRESVDACACGPVHRKNKCVYSDASRDLEVDDRDDPLDVSNIDADGYRVLRCGL